MTCMVLSGAFAFFVQGLLGVVSISVLAYKYHRDPAGRSPYQFCLDSSKQLAGAAWLHVLNLAFAMVLEKGREGDQCAWYWIEIMIDTTIGVAVEYYLLKLLVRSVSLCSRDLADKVVSGQYVDEDGKFMLCSYIWQMCAWLVVVSGMKCIMVAMMLASATGLEAVALVILHPFLLNPQLKLLVVMIFTPAVMNSLQFWLVDNIFVHSKPTKADRGCYSRLP
eukprot:TRINITY_DN58032_c0_g1_i1.p1 TRINITY_DN58032_c0_g1~~TRINITY_DN58032_c0_g1_i1.p1  ORF type:complete len:222 (-),score=34.79 TRINITY_DN58032_c0_g1_i1:112-777(-)